MRIENVPALVTGGGSGLGEATARRLAKAGARVAILDVNMTGAERVAGEIGGLALKTDVTSKDDVSAALAKASAAHGPARILVNCAGIAVANRVLGRDGPSPLEEFERVVSVNLVGSFNALRLAAAEMSGLDPLEDGERGVIVSTASVAAYEGQIGQAAYSASKGGIVGMTLPIAREFARFGIRVLAIAPGLFMTPLLGSLPADLQEKLGASIPFPSRLGQPEDYAHLLQSMVENVYLNGEVVRLDGALRMPPK